MSSQSRAMFLFATLAGCASAGHDYGRAGADGGITVIDSPTHGTDPDAPVDNGVDAEPHHDAGQCTVQTLNILMNGDFDSTPEGVGWTSMPIMAAYPIVTTDAGPIGAQSGTERAWMGGFEQTSTDSIYADITIPAGTTDLTITGYWALFSDEGTTTAYDKGYVDLLQTSGAQIESVLAIDNRNPASTWTAFSHTVANPAGLSGQTVRVQMKSTSDDTNVTSFFFDTLALNATACQ